MTINSCKIYKNNSKCKSEVKRNLEYLAKAISYDKQAKVYTLFYSKLPQISQDRFLKLSDSLESISYLPHDLNRVKHYLYCKQLKELIQPNCEISLDMIRKYFVEESAQGTRNGEIHSLFYMFNIEGKPECYNRYGEFGPYSKCTGFTLKVKDGILTEVLTDSFGF